MFQKHLYNAIVFLLFGIKHLSELLFYFKENLKSTLYKCMSLFQVDIVFSTFIKVAVYIKYIYSLTKIKVLLKYAS